MSAISDLIMPNDISDLCRVCLQLPDVSQYLDLTTIYDEEENLTYGECFTVCTEIDLSAGEGVPHYLCKPCGMELQMAYNFHKKIEESKRVIQQYQRNLKTEVLNDAGLLADDEQFENLHMNDQVDTKYVISTGDVQNPETSETACETTQTENEPNYLEPADVNDDIIETITACTTEAVCKTEAVSKCGIPQDDTLSIAEMNEDLEENFEFEALEDEESETLQIKECENTLCFRERIYERLESEENAVFVEYADDLNEQKVEELSSDAVDVVYVKELHVKDVEDKLAWQENVVAVANKEHLPIESEDDDGNLVKQFVTIDKSQSFVIKSLQDETVEMLAEEEEGEAVYIEIDDEAKEFVENNVKGRKRHVGSYSCDYCHRVYPNYSRMKTHRRCHEQDREKFACTQCGRMYATKQARDCHIQTAHNKSGYACNICDKIFAIRKSLEIHVRYHTGDFPFACSLCDRKFAQACHLNTHVNVKHNQIRFSCEYPNCGKFFTSSSSLRNHEYTHSSMPFECEYCGQGYPAKSKLRVHVQRKHGVNATNEELEKMRVFHVMRSKVNLVQFVDS